MSSWDETATRLSLHRHRPLEDIKTPPRRGGVVPFFGGGPGAFEDDMQRWQWELRQWKFHKDVDHAWLDSSGDRIYGPPIYPGAAVVQRNSFLLAVEQAREMGFVLGREMWIVAFKRPSPLPMQLECVRKVATRYPEIVRCVLRLPLLEVEGVTVHMRCFVLEELVQSYLQSPEAPILRKKYMAAWRLGCKKNSIKRAAAKAKLAARDRRRAKRAAEKAAIVERRIVREAKRAAREQQK